VFGVISLDLDGVVSDLSLVKWVVGGYERGGFDFYVAVGVILGLT